MCTEVSYMGPVCHNAQCVHACEVASVLLFVTLWTVALQTPLSKGFSRQEYGCGLPCPPPGDLPDSRYNLCLLMSPELAGGSLPLAPPRKPLISCFLRV